MGRHAHERSRVVIVGDKLLAITVVTALIDDLATFDDRVPVWFLALDLRDAALPPLVGAPLLTIGVEPWRARTHLLSTPFVARPAAVGKDQIGLVAVAVALDDCCNTSTWNVTLGEFGIELIVTLHILF